ncbi:hypothetical protein [uncultured Erythrobacter sp.]|uniref:hypothetical protein n=1 Tax=uncultured Erythrobacter sp. TaxID=263913 RepID=UPI00261C1A80|nr:hypothetical protein [uncultured Erythrobacter sp.]
MTKLSRLALIAPFAALAAVPAAAQDQAGDRVNLVIAYSEDECPEQTAENEIVVCQIVVEADRYRIPSNLRTSNSPENITQSQQFEKVRYIGEFGAFSCSPAGAGGFTGCTQQFIEAAFDERRRGEGVRFGQLIEEERRKRLETIDDDAAAEQSRVEQIEREYLERLERERSAPLAGEQELPATVQGEVDVPDEGPN